MTKFYTVYEKMSEKEAQTMIKHNRSVSGIYTSNDGGETLIPYTPPKVVDMQCIVGHRIPVRIYGREGFLKNHRRIKNTKCYTYGLGMDNNGQTYSHNSCVFVLAADAWVISSCHPSNIWPEGVWVDFLMRSGSVISKYNPNSRDDHRILSWDCVVATKFNSLMDGWVYSHEA